jgi:hypothetical protein
VGEFLHRDRERARGVGEVLLSRNECAVLGEECVGLGEECAVLGEECAGLGEECAGLGEECASGVVEVSRVASSVYSVAGVLNPGFLNSALSELVLACANWSLLSKRILREETSGPSLANGGLRVRKSSRKSGAPGTLWAG